MKFKKSWIFWICYYGVAITANVLAAILLRDKWNFNGWSAFPIAYIVILSYQGFYLPTERYLQNRYNYHRTRFSDLNKYPDFEQFDRRWKKNWENEKKANRLASFLSFLCVPFYFIFVFFFSKTLKILSVIPLFFVLLFWAFVVILKNASSQDIQ